MSSEKIILIMMLVISLFVVVISGCTSMEGDYENSILSFKIPENWTVSNSNSSDALVSLKPVNSADTLISIHSSDVKPAEIIEGYINNYPAEYPRFEVLKQESVHVNGQQGEKMVYKNTASNDYLIVGPDYISSVVVFSKDNKTYIISSSEVMNDMYYSQVEPAMNVVVGSLRIKGNLLGS
jgi:hypothetical protein